MKDFTILLSTVFDHILMTWDTWKYISSISTYNYEIPWLHLEH